MKELIIMLGQVDSEDSEFIAIAKGKYESTTFWKDVKQLLKLKED